MGRRRRCNGTTRQHALRGVTVRLAGMQNHGGRYWCRKRIPHPGPREPNNHGLFSGPGSPPLDLILWTLQKATAYLRLLSRRRRPLRRSGCRAGRGTSPPNGPTDSKRLADAFWWLALPNKCGRAKRLSATLLQSLWGACPDSVGGAAAVSSGVDDHLVQSMTTSVGVAGHRWVVRPVWRRGPAGRFCSGGVWDLEGGAGPVGVQGYTGRAEVVRELRTWLFRVSRLRSRLRTLRGQ